MSKIEEKFAKLATEHAPGQESRQAKVGEFASQLRGNGLDGVPVDFSHGDVNESAFSPTPGSLEAFIEGVGRGGEQAYTEYRGDAALCDRVASHLGKFTGCPVSGPDELILTPGTQSALFLAVAATVMAGDKVAIVRPDYFANRKIVEFLGGEVVPVRLSYLGATGSAGLDLQQLEDAFKAGAKTLLFSNPNNPVGVIYSATEIDEIASLANRYGAIVVVDQLYSRLVYARASYTHLRSAKNTPEQVITIMGPSKTESLSGYRLGVAFGPKHLIDRMEKLQAIVSLRAPGYCQAVLRTWFEEPAGWLDDRIAKHQVIRDDLMAIFQCIEGGAVRSPDAGSYLFPRLPPMAVSLHDFIRILRHQAAVTVTPGTEFSPYATDSVRLNFSQNRVAAAQAADRLARVVERYRS